MIDSNQDMPDSNDEVAPGGPASHEPSVADTTAHDISHRLHPNHIQVERIGGVIVAGAISLGLVVGDGLICWTNEYSVTGWLLMSAAAIVVAGLVSWLALAWPAIEYRRRTYRIEERGIEICKGVLWRQVLYVPRSRVQHTDVNQGPIQRRYGVATLVIHTAGTTSANVTLEGLGYDTAVALRDQLIDAEGGDAV